jgi:hypothetical protein
VAERGSKAVTVATLREGLMAFGASAPFSAALVGVRGGVPALPSPQALDPALWHS